MAYLFLTLYSKTPATTSHFHGQKTSKVESLFFSKNWQPYFSRVYLFWTPPPIHRIIPLNLAPPSLASSHAISAAPARSQVHRIIHFNLAPPSLASSHAISAPPARPQPVHRPFTGSISSLLPCDFCTPARPHPVHRPSTGSWPSILLLHL